MTDMFGGGVQAGRRGARAAGAGLDNVGIALGGGAARGLAHIGALRSLDEAGIRAQALAGTSYGAIIAALYALVGNAHEVERVIRAQDVAEIWRQGLDFGLHKGALIHGRRLSEWLDRKFFFGASFADSPTPLAIACTDLNSGEPVVIKDGQIASAVRASCALPGIFAPVRTSGQVLIDGGFIEAVPFEALAALGTFTRIGLHAGVDARRSAAIRAIKRFNVSAAGRSFHRFAHRPAGRGPFTQMVRGLSISLRSYSRPLSSPPGALLVSVQPDIGWWDFHRSPQAIGAGYRAMNEMLASLDAWSAQTAVP